MDLPSVLTRLRSFTETSVPITSKYDTAVGLNGITAVTAEVLLKSLAEIGFKDFNCFPGGSTRICVSAYGDALADRFHFYDFNIEGTDTYLELTASYRDNTADEIVDVFRIPGRICIAEALLVVRP